MDFLKPYGAVPSARQMAHYKIEKKAFFHFGVNTFTSLEWGDGTEKESFWQRILQSRSGNFRICYGI